MTRRAVALGFVLVGGALLVVAAAVAFGLAAALAAAGVELVAFGLLFVDVAPREVSKSGGAARGVTAQIRSRAA